MNKMNKWENLPEDVLCWAIDANGAAHFYTEMPVEAANGWNCEPGSFFRDNSVYPNWRESLEMRPTTTTKSEFPTQMPDWKNQCVLFRYAVWDGNQWIYERCINKAVKLGHIIIKRQPTN